MSGGVQVMRIETRPTLDGPMLKHYMGESRPDSARDIEEAVVPLLGPIDISNERVNEARRMIAADRAKPRPGRRGHEAVDVLLAGPPSYASPDAWPEARVRAWASACAEWFSAALGEEAVVAGAWLHRDEASPHVHMVVVPVADGRLSWKATRGHIVKNLRVRSGAEPRRSGRGPSWRDTFGFMQDRLHADVSSYFGLARGEVGSKRKHERPTRQAGLEARAKILERQADLAAQDAEEQRKVADGYRAHARTVVASMQAATERRAGECDELDAQIEALTRERDRLAAESDTLTAQIEDLRRERELMAATNDVQERAAIAMHFRKAREAEGRARLAHRSAARSAGAEH